MHCKLNGDVHLAIVTKQNNLMLSLTPENRPKHSGTQQKQNTKEAQNFLAVKNDFYGFAITELINLAQVAGAMHQENHAHCIQGTW